MDTLCLPAKQRGCVFHLCVPSEDRGVFILTRGTVTCLVLLAKKKSHFFPLENLCCL